MSNKILDFSNIKGDVFGGLTAGVVALPLALAFGVTSGMGAIAGLYGAVAIGIIAAIFGGTATQVSGPTGPMTVVSGAVIGAAVEASGSLEQGFGLIITAFFLAGAFQIVFSFLRIGKYVRYIPYPVLSGFMSGIGVIILILQIFPFLGHSGPAGIIEILKNIGAPLSAINWQAVGLASGTIAIIYLFPRLTKAVPSSLVALVVGSVVAFLLKLDVPLIGDIPSGIPALQFGALFHFEGSQTMLAIEFGLTLALLGAIDSLLTSVVADNVTKTQHNSNRELFGQGLGNIAASLIGGIPGAGATIRTIVNINAGGRTRLSGLIHGLFLLLVLLAAGPVAAQIPLSVLAGILITVGIGIIDYKGLKHLIHVPRADAAVLIIVLLITVFNDLLVAVGVGMVLSSLLFMKKISDLSEAKSVVSPIKEGEVVLEDEKEVIAKYGKKIYIKHIYGPLFFGFTSGFKELVKSVPDIKVVVIRLDRVPYIDQSGLYALEDAIMDLEKRGVAVVLTGVNSQHLDMLKRINIVPGLVPKHMIFNQFGDCQIWLAMALDEDNDNLKEIMKKIQEEHRAPEKGYHKPRY